MTMKVEAFEQALDRFDKVVAAMKAQREADYCAYAADLAEALALLALIDAEFQSDPDSVQCFDLRIVERVRTLVARHRL